MTLVDYIYEQPPAEIFARLLPRLVETQIFRALLESIASEQGARMTAMDSASKNARELIDSLTLNMNRVRQAAITNEIIEVVSGAARNSSVVSKSMIVKGKRQARLPFVISSSMNSAHVDSRKTTALQRFWRYGPLVLWMVFISFASTSEFSASTPRSSSSANSLAFPEP